MSKTHLSSRGTFGRGFPRLLNHYSPRVPPYPHNEDFYDVPPHFSSRKYENSMGFDHGKRYPHRNRYFEYDEFFYDFDERMGNERPRHSSRGRDGLGRRGGYSRGRVLYNINKFRKETDDTYNDEHTSWSVGFHDRNDWKHQRCDGVIHLSQRKSDGNEINRNHSPMPSTNHYEYRGKFKKPLSRSNLENLGVYKGESSLAFKKSNLKASAFISEKKTSKSPCVVKVELELTPCWEDSDGPDKTLNLVEMNVKNEPKESSKTTDSKTCSTADSPTYDENENTTPPNEEETYSSDVYENTTYPISANHDCIIYQDPPIIIHPEDPIAYDPYLEGGISYVIPGTQDIHLPGFHSCPFPVPSSTGNTGNAELLEQADENYINDNAEHSAEYNTPDAGEDVDSFLKALDTESEEGHIVHFHINPGTTVNFTTSDGSEQRISGEYYY